MLREKSRKTFFVLLCSVLFASCNFDQPVKQWFDYWTSTCQVGKIEYASENTLLNGETNLYANDPVEINLYLVNPQKFKLLQNPATGQNCFTFKDEDGKTIAADHEEIIVDPTWIKIRADLPDESEGKKITLSGCLWPENRSGFSEDQLKTQCPQLFYSASFVQNTPPDNIKNLQRAENFFPGTEKCYISFEVPDQSLNRNKDSSYEVKYFFRNDDNSLEYKGSKVLTLADNKNPSAESDVFMYYFDEQVKGFINRYEYTVQVIGPHGLTADIRSTDPALGACVLVEPSITVLDIPNGLSDEDSDGDYECYEIDSEADCITFTAVPGQEGDTLTVTDTVTDNETVLNPASGNTYTVSGLGRHEIKVTSSRTDAFSVTVTKRIRIVVTPNPATFRFCTNDTDTYFNDLTDTNGFEYLEVPQSTSTVGYTISPTEEGTTLSVTLDGTDYNGPVNGVNIDVGPHTLVAVIHKQYCNDVTTTRKIMVAKTLEAPVYTFTPDLNGKAVGDFEYLEVPSSTAKTDYTIKPSPADGNAKVSGSVGSTLFAATNQQTGELSVGSYIIKVTVSKDYMIPREFIRNIKVDSKLTPPEIAFTSPAPNGKRDDMSYEYIEVANSSSKASYKVINKDSRDGTTVSTVVTDMLDDTQVSTNNSGNLDAGIPGSPKKYKIVATVKKDGYEDQTTTKFVAVVAKLKTPKITFGSAFNGKGQDSDGYYYIEVANSTDQVSYTSSTDDNSSVTVTTKINGWAKSNSGTLGIGDHEIEVTAHCSFQDDVTFTQKVWVVQELQEPEYSFTPDLTTESGKKWIEVPAENTNATCRISAKGGSSETLTVKENGVTISSPGNFTRGLGTHKFSITVERPYYTTKTFTKEITVVKELQKPEFAYYKDSSHTKEAYTVENASTAESICMAYGDNTYSIDLKNDGSNLYYVTSLGAEESLSIVDETNGNVALSSSSDNLPLGPHRLKLVVSKDNYKDKEYEELVYVQGELTKPTFSTSNGSETAYSGVGDSSGDPWRYRFSYLSYNNMDCSISPGNEGNTVSLKVDGSNKTYSSFTLSAGNSTSQHELVVTQTREYCKPLVTEWYVNVMINPITLKFANNNAGAKGSAFMCMGGYDGEGSFNANGEIKLNDTTTIWGWGTKNDLNHIGADGWTNLSATENTGRSFEMVCTTPDDKVTLHAIDMRRRNGSSMSGDKTSVKTLSNIKRTTSIPACGYQNKAPAQTTSGWTLWTGRLTDNTHYVYIYVTFEVSESN